MPDAEKGRVRRPFRLLGWIVGPLMAVGGIWILADSIGALLSGGWSSLRTHSHSTALGIGSIAMAILILRAAITGRDPYVPRDE